MVNERIKRAEDRLERARKAAQAAHDAASLRGVVAEDDEDAMRASQAYARAFNALGRIKIEIEDTASAPGE
jgi:hypothetical protein